MSPDAAPTSVGFIGLGNMGAPMARRLLQEGFEVRGFDVSEPARDALAEAGGTAAPTAVAAVAGADVVVLMLPDSNVVEAVVGAAEFAGALAESTVIVDMSSSEPQRTRELAERLAGRGIGFVDAPVSGGVAKAGTGQLAVMVGGADEQVARVEPVLAALGRIFRAGPVGAGHAVKALNNLMSATHLLVTSEAMVIGEQFGLDPETMLAVFNASSGRSGSTENKWPNFVLPGSYDSGFGLRLMLKDMRIATGLADAVKAPSRLGADAVDIWAEAAAALPPAADHTEIARWLRAGSRATEESE